jgi:hypothetical protein
MKPDHTREPLVGIRTPEEDRQSPRAFYAASVREFLLTSPNSVIGVLSRRHVGFHRNAEAEQVRAWEREIEILRQAFAEVGPQAETWSLLIEIPLLRLGKRLDAILLAGDVVAVIEFKIGATRFETADRQQTEFYAQALRDFHEVARTRRIVPILCAELGPKRPINMALFDGVFGLVEVNALTLGEVLRAIFQPVAGMEEPTSWFEFDTSAYRPTPTIVEAAQALYAGHQIADIGRGDAADAELQEAAAALKDIVEAAQNSFSKTVCFVTGAPGAGKTLLGLDLALRGRTGETPAALLSGNRPLVHVLTEALANDVAQRTDVTKERAKYEANAAIQNLLAYLKEHTDGAAPPENVIVFDEAQRAWDAEVGQELMGRPQSEPELFLDILDRLTWACLVCLVGPGQEINRGEGGLPLWGEALASAADRGRPWTIVAAPQAIHGGKDVAGAGLQPVAGTQLPVHEERRIHLANSVRAYRNELHGQWVAALLEGDRKAVHRVIDEMTAPPAFIARDLSVAKAWLRQHRRGGRSVGLLASSGAVRLVADGIPPTLRSNELGPIGHWFLKPSSDFRSSSALEIPMSEFGCQGLEIDYAGLCWGGDLIRGDSGWVPRQMRAPRWQILRGADKRRFRMNGYRVLLTRARAGLVIYVPVGDREDPTRSPGEFDEIADCLIDAGCEMLW